MAATNCSSRDLSRLHSRAAATIDMSIHSLDACATSAPCWVRTSAWVAACLASANSTIPSAISGDSTALAGFATNLPVVGKTRRRGVRDRDHAKAVREARY